MPTKVDALYAKAAKYLGGVMEDILTINRLTFNFIHISVPHFWGNSARRFRYLMLENATFILLFVSCIAYDEFADDGTINCLVNSCDRFDGIINSRFFARKSVILLFTKADLLEEKIKHSNIKEYFPEFQGDPRKLQDVQDFVIRMFDERRQDKSKALCHYFTAAGNTENIRFVFAAVMDTILANNLKSVKTY